MIDPIVLESFLASNVGSDTWCSGLPAELRWLVRVAQTARSESRGEGIPPDDPHMAAILRHVHGRMGDAHLQLLEPWLRGHADYASFDSIFRLAADYAEGSE